MFLKHGAKQVNEIELVAPTGFEPVLESREGERARGVVAQYARVSGGRCGSIPGTLTSRRQQ